MSESSYRRTNEPTAQEVEPSTAGATGGGDLEEEPELLHEWHDHAPLGYHDEAVQGCPACEARWELPEESYRRTNEPTAQEIESSTAGATSDDDLEEWDWSGICDHDCDEECDWYGCHHEHCFNCGECGCAGYCDDYQTYNLRPEETGG